jgi:hypothetical protein
MINSGKCPICETTITAVRAEGVEVTQGFQPKWLGASFCCPSCNMVLGVGIDPLAIKTDIVNEIKRAMRKS